MGNAKKTPQPIEDYCCGSYSSEAGCCKFQHQPKGNPRQRELLPEEINKKSKFRYPDFVARWQVRGRSSPPGYMRITVPDWVKEGRNRDTDSNLD